MIERMSFATLLDLMGLNADAVRSVNVTTDGVTLEKYHLNDEGNFYVLDGTNSVATYEETIPWPERVREEIEEEPERVREEIEEEPPLADDDPVNGLSPEEAEDGDPLPYSEEDMRERASELHPADHVIREAVDHLGHVISSLVSLGVELQDDRVKRTRDDQDLIRQLRELRDEVGKIVSGEGF